MLSAAGGILLSLLFSYIPGLSDWYAAQTGTTKRLVMLATLLVLAASSLYLACLGYRQLGGVNLPECSPDGLAALAQAFVTALVANQATYLISPQRQARQDAPRSPEASAGGAAA
jgi:hypothetical protein